MYCTKKYLKKFKYPSKTVKLVLILLSCVYSVAINKEKVDLYGGTKINVFNVTRRFKAIDETSSHFWENIIKYGFSYAKLKEIIQEGAPRTLVLPSGRHYDRLSQWKFIFL